jgi:branched-subunit amino acid transport protein
MAMSAVWTTIAGLTVVTAAIKATGPLALGGRELPEWAMSIIALLAPALLAALVMVETFSDEHELVIDARAGGVAAAAVALALRASLPVTVTVAAVVASGLRLVS